MTKPPAHAPAQPWQPDNFDDPGRMSRTKRKTAAQEQEEAERAALQAEIEQLRETARQTGHAEGHASGLAEGRLQGHSEGHAAGYQQGLAQAQSEAQQLAGLSARLDAALGEFDVQMSQDLLALSLEIARQLVGQSLRVHPELLLETLRQVLMQLHHPHATITVHPEDAALIRQHLSDSPLLTGQRIHEDPHMTRGGCTVEAAGSQIDATLETRWRRIAERLGNDTAWLVTDDATITRAHDDSNDGRNPVGHGMP